MKRLLLPLAGLVLILVSNETGGSAPPTVNHSAPPLSMGRALRTARLLEQAAQTISQRYFQEVSEAGLLSAALRALYEAVGAQLPEGSLAVITNQEEDLDRVRAIAELRRALGDVPQLKDNRDVRLGVAGMLATLDPFSVLYQTDEVLASSIQAKVDIGITFEEPAPGDSPWYVRQVQPHSPAEAAGLKPGDAVLLVDGVPPPSRVTPVALAQSLAAPAETRRQLTIRRLGDSKPTKVEVHFAIPTQVAPPLFGVRRVDEATWDCWLVPDKQIAYLRLGSLGYDLVDPLNITLAQLVSEGMKGLVLDLRDCPGGILDSAVEVADWLLPRQVGMIAKVRYGNARTNAATLRQLGRMDAAEFPSRFEPIVPLSIPIVVLIGPDTSGGGELVAAALQDYRRATVVGQRSRGKGSVQPVVEEPGLPAFRLSTGLLFRPNGKSYHRGPDSGSGDVWGIQPDATGEVRLPAALHRQIRRWRHDYERRPMGNRQLLPLDLPQNDPVLARGLKLLLAPQPPVN